MTPDFVIIADSKNVTDAIRTRLLSLSVSDSAGWGSDTLEITLDDRDGSIVIPRTGAELDVSIGYRETGLARMGVYIVDETAISGPPATMTIRAKAADMQKSLKSRRTRAWDNTTIADIVSAIAGAHGYEPRIEDVLGSEAVEHIDQIDESDMHFLTRLAEDRGAVAKPAGRAFVFAPRGEAKSASGAELTAAELTVGQLTRYEVTQAERGKYGAVTARWYDTFKAVEETVKAGDGEPVYTISRKHASADAAKKAAEAQLAAFERGTSKLTLVCVGNPALMAEAPLTVSGVRAGVDGEWIITTVTHRMDGAGYQCDVEAETP
jgi:phage protein D